MNKFCVWSLSIMQLIDYVPDPLRSVLYINGIDLKLNISFKDRIETFLNILNERQSTDFIYFSHCPRTAGTELCGLLREYEFVNVLNLDADNKTFFTEIELILQNPQKKIILRSHYSLDKIAASGILDKSFLYFTIRKEISKIYLSLVKKVASDTINNVIDYRDWFSLNSNTYDDICFELMRNNKFIAHYHSMVSRHYNINLSTGYFDNILTMDVSDVDKILSFLNINQVYTNRLPNVHGLNSKSLETTDDFDLYKKLNCKQSSVDKIIKWVKNEI